MLLWITLMETGGWHKLNAFVLEWVSKSARKRDKQKRSQQKKVDMFDSHLTLAYYKFNGLSVCVRRLGTGAV